MIPDDQSEGFLSSGIAWAGVKFLERTYFDNQGNTRDYGVSAFHSVPRENDTQSDAEAYNLQLLGGNGA